MGRGYLLALLQTLGGPRPLFRITESSTIVQQPAPTRRATDIASTTTTSVVVVDDHITFSDLVAMALEHQPDFTCVGTASSVAQALAVVDKLRPDLVLMDVRMGDGDGVAATAELTRLYPKLRVVVLTAHKDTALLQRAADAGACALLAKDGSLPDMLQVLRTARPGGLVVGPVLMTALAKSQSLAKSHLEPLTPREGDVLNMLAEGSDARAIARDLGISVNTCRFYVKSLLVKLDAHSQLEAVVIATKRGLVSVGAAHHHPGAARSPQLQRVRRYAHEVASEREQHRR
jgi:DNA-binding NarL/FixJ family response regulator